MRMRNTSRVFVRIWMCFGTSVSPQQKDAPPTKMPRGRQKAGLHLQIQRGCFFGLGLVLVVFFFQPGPALHDVGSDAAQLLSFDLSMLYLLLVLCRFPVSAVSPEARREMLCFKQDGL